MAGLRETATQFAVAVADSHSALCLYLSLLGYLFCGLRIMFSMLDAKLPENVELVPVIRAASAPPDGVSFIIFYFSSELSDFVFSHHILFYRHCLIFTDVVRRRNIRSQL